MAAAEAAGMPVGAWIEQTLRQALEAKAEPPLPKGVEIEELEAMVRRVLAEELQPVKEAMVRPGTAAASPSLANSSPVSSMRKRLRQRRAR